MNWKIYAITLLTLSAVYFAGFGTAAFEAHAQANIVILPTTFADVAATGSTIQVNASTAPCRTITFTSTAGTDAIRVGDASTSSSRGQIIAAGGSYTPPPSGNINFVYTPASWYFYAASSGDHLGLICTQ